MNQITHDSLRSLVWSLPERQREAYFAWRKQAAAANRATNRGGFDFAGPEFLAECLQKLLALQKEVDQRVNAFAAPEPTLIHSIERNLQDGTSEG